MNGDTGNPEFPGQIKSSAAEIMRLLGEANTEATGLAPVIYKLIALWIEDRKARKIKIKHGEYELELQGGISSRERFSVDLPNSGS